MSEFRKVVEAVLRNFADCELDRVEVDYMEQVVGTEDPPALEIDMASTVMKNNWIIEIGDSISIEEREAEVL